MRTTFLTAAVAAALGSPAPALAADPVTVAHRGGPVVEGVPTFPEETMPAFRNAWEREKATLELDVKLTRDRVPVVIHDDTLDRTTTCTGPVKDVDVAAFKACRADVVGSGLRTRPARQPVELPTLSEALAYARGAGAPVLLEIKNLPEDNDFDPTSRFADTVMDAVIASGFPRERLIVQSFRFENLDAARAKLPGVQLMYLTNVANNATGIQVARDRGYQWWSPSGVPSKGTVDQAHAARVKVAPYTINDVPPMQRAAEVGVDAIVTDDPARARLALLTVSIRPETQSLRRVDRLRYIPVRVRASSAAELDFVVRRGSRVISRRTVEVGPRATTIRLRVKRRDLGGRRVTITVEAGTTARRITLR